MELVNFLKQGPDHGYPFFHTTPVVLPILDAVGVLAIEGTSVTIGNQLVAAHEVNCPMTFTQKTLDQASPAELETMVEDHYLWNLNVLISKAIVDGDGIDKPQGILREGMVPHRGLPELLLDYIIDAIYAIHLAQRAQGCFIMNDRTAGECKKLKGGDGRFAWQEGLSRIDPPRLLGFPVYIVNDYPDKTLTFGDHRRAYCSVVSPVVRIIRDSESVKPHVMLQMFRRAGGSVVEPSAIVRVSYD